MKGFIIKHADGPVLLVLLIKLFLLTLLILCFLGCATITDADGNLVAESHSFGRDLEYSETICFYESGMTQSYSRTYSTKETVSGFLGSVNKIIGTAVGAAANAF